MNQVENTQTAPKQRRCKPYPTYEKSSVEWWSVVKLKTNRESGLQHSESADARDLFLKEFK